MTPKPVEKRFILEVAVASVEDAQAAEAGGADRLELNAALSLGGLTPSLGTLIEIRQSTKLPLFVMLRPRPGAFCYRQAEFRLLLRDLDLVLSHSADGIVFGVLNEDATIDRRRCRDVLRQAGPHPVVFHRAFDLTPQPTQALEELIDFGVCRVMTSGQKRTALAGAAQIASLLRQAAGRIEVLPAGGIRSDHIVELIRQTGCAQAHAGLRGQGRDPSALGRLEIDFTSKMLGPHLYELVDGTLVREMRKIIDGL
jgi:copper homeostasis protein